ncbi:alcohol dehydrogenase catalytic domain-containing protein [Streptomyces fulvoviolaceus]|uniref:alcohol dehydrogenase catalytic domain-containing protein n=1 Tax=Streptomyces fulvoviolaceus TaxID=285535 RepID=UPI0021BFF9A0|nr:alcohol dehydrogenase catalytic domain-containing protein [Streptomyces fulvoviolaceus]MCT9080702.1 alcohol dehydrogenase catalytic domain-containing protein [Streptomyces fulvoviolaceus]
MLAALGLDHGHYLSVEEVAPRKPGPHDIVVRVGASGVCHTDVAVLGGHLPMPLPLVLGHEGAGVVAEIGSEVTSVAVGDGGHRHRGRCVRHLLVLRPRHDPPLRQQHGHDLGAARQKDRRHGGSSLRRPRHLRQGDDRARGKRGPGDHGPAGRTARADRMRHHHRPGGRCSTRLR